MRRAYRWAVLWFLLGEQYFVLEGLYRFVLKGGERPHIAMLAVGGLCCLVVGYINQIPRFYHSPVWVQSLIGTAATLGIEYASGCVLNLWLGLGIWDYTGVVGNIHGQVCLPFAVAWFLLMPLAIWLEDTLRLKMWGEGEAYTLKSIYTELFTGK